MNPPPPYGSPIPGRPRPPADQAPGAAGQRPPAQPGGAERRWLGVLFRCHNVYARAWMTADATRYTGKCPRCGAAVEFRVGAGGTNRRFFEAG